MLWILGLILSAVVAVAAIGISLSRPGFEGLTSDHFDGKKFRNLSGITPRGFKGLIKWLIRRKPGDWKKVTTAGYGAKPAEKTHSANVTFINHATFLIQVDGVNIITDPIYSDRASPFTWIGPRRMKPPGLRFADLPTIDYVLISHNHYDHLDKETLLQLRKNFDPWIITPLGVGEFLIKTGLDKVIEIDWSREIRLSPTLQLVSVPAQHFSGRGFLDRDQTLWCGYVIKTTGGNIYFAGDTGYDHRIFRTIGKNYAPIVLSMLPIGAYLPQWFMSPVHMSPGQAVDAHLDLQSRQSIAMHFGTFPLGDDGQEQPVNELHKVLANQPDVNFVALEEGESIHLT